MNVHYIVTFCLGGDNQIVYMDCSFIAVLISSEETEEATQDCGNILSG